MWIPSPPQRQPQTRPQTDLQGQCGGVRKAVLRLWDVAWRHGRRVRAAHVCCGQGIPGRLVRCGHRISVAAVHRAAAEGSCPMMLTVDEAAALCRVCRSTFERRVKPHVPHVRIGRRVLYEQSTLMAWLDGQKVGPSSGEAELPTSGSRSAAGVTLTPRGKEILRELRGKQQESTQTRSMATLHPALGSMQ